MLSHVYDIVLRYSAKLIVPSQLELIGVNQHHWTLVLFSTYLLYCCVIYWLSGQLWMVYVQAPISSEAHVHCSSRSSKQQKTNIVHLIFSFFLKVHLVSQNFRTVLHLVICPVHFCFQKRGTMKQSTLQNLIKAISCSHVVPLQLRQERILEKKYKNIIFRDQNHNFKIEVVRTIHDK